MSFKKSVIIAALLLPVAAILYLLVVLNWSYAEGEKVGFVHTFGKRGWISKTWEGELTVFTAQYTASPEKFSFTVRDRAVAEKLSSLLGQKVRLRYEEHAGVPTRWFGETPYYVVDVTRAD